MVCDVSILAHTAASCRFYGCIINKVFAVAILSVCASTKQ